MGRTVQEMYNKYICFAMCSPAMEQFHSLKFNIRNINLNSTLSLEEIFIHSYYGFYKSIFLILMS